MERKSLGQVGYEAYASDAGGHSLVTGDPLPEWQRLSPDIRAAWRAAAEAIHQQLIEEGEAYARPETHTQGDDA